MNKFITIALMLFFSFGNSQSNEKSIYLAGWEAVFNGDEQCLKFIETQVINKETANTIYASIELVFKDNKLIKAYDYEEGTKTKRQLNDNELGLQYKNVEPHQIFQLTRSSKSDSYLGGDVPKDFTMPKFEFNAPFQYLGKISKSDEAFSWIPFDIHLVAPIYLNFDKLYIDYSDPMHPKIIDIEALKDTDNSYDDLKPDSEVVFEKTYFKGIKANEFGYKVGHTGAPNWTQYPEIPSSPKNNKIMKFLCQLKSNDQVKTKHTNVNPTDEWYKQYFDHMNFWGDGDLYIFFDPESKIACFIIQIT